MQDRLKKTTKVVKALADDTRIRIINLLTQKSRLCVCEIHAVIGLSQPTISSHLKVLENAGLLISKKEGLWVEYMLDPGMEPFQEDIIKTLSQNIRDDKIIEVDLEKSKEVDREQITKSKKTQKGAL